MAKSCLEANGVESLEIAATNLRDRLLIRLLFHLVREIMSPNLKEKEWLEEKNGG